MHDLHAHRDVPVVLMSGFTDLAFARGALELGADGYVTKPFDETQVVIAIANAIRRGRLERENRTRRDLLEEMVEERTRALSSALDELRLADDELQRSASQTFHSLAQAIEGRDTETGHHVVRVSRYTRVLAAACGHDDARADVIALASAMHDVGKVGVPDGILFKPGRFTPAEYEVIKQHALLGERILSDSSQPLVQTAAAIAGTHHERWDGSGYPRGTAGAAIPLEGRIAAVADVFDALVSDRVYKRGLAVDDALEIIRKGRSSLFDPDVVDAFFDNVDDILAVRASYPDGWIVS
jgi:putative two-component system response regulator